ncbi:MAG: hypothetical protein U0176_21985 [Bacteroidia bacterium]
MLKPAEAKQVDKALKAQAQNSKRLEFFRHILASPKSMDDDAAKAIYGREPSSAFSHLKARLYENILEIIFPDNLPVLDAAPDRHRYDCLRKILLAQFFMSREAFLNAALILQEAEGIARQATLTPESVLIADIGSRLHAQMSDEDLSEPDAQQPLITDLMDTLRQDMDARHMALQLEKLSERHNFLLKDLPSALHEAASLWELQSENLPTGLAYWRMRMLIQYCLIGRNWEAAANTAGKLAILVEEAAATLSDADRHHAHLIVAKAYYAAGRQDDARFHLDLVFASASSSSLASLLALELALQLSLYASDLDSAIHYHTVAQQHPKFSLSEFRQSKWRLFQAALAYGQGSYHDSLQLIQETKELFRYKSKWLLGIKVLEIYNFIALGKHDLVEYKLNALKQLLKRQKGHDIGRCKVIARVIGTYLRLHQNGEILQRPQAGDLSEHWAPFDYEVVPLEGWLSTLREETAAAI